MSDLTWTNERRKLSELVPWERNPRQIREGEARRLAESLDDFGQIHAIAIDPSGGILDGHQRRNVWTALDRYGSEYAVDVRVASRALTKKERERLVAVLHVGAVGDWDWDALSGWDAGELQDWGFDADTLRSWNDDAANLALMLDAEEEEPPEDPGAQVDRAEELREKWGVETGQLWRLGEHRLICGDCTDAEVVARVMGGEKAGLCVTDPPYGVTKEEWDRPFLQHDLDMMLDNTSGLVACFNAARPEALLSMLSLSPIPERVGVWRYSSITPKPGMIWSWQPVFYWRCSGAIGWDSLDWFQGNADKTGTHPTQKPVKFFEKIINSVSGTIVYEPFCGSGTTIVAAERQRRRCFAVEIEPKYVAVAIERWAQMTGGTPELVG